MKKVWEYISVKATYALSTKRLMAWVMLVIGLIRMGLLIFFAQFAIYPMVALNICSVLLYLLCYVSVQMGKSLLWVFNLSYAEIIIHAVIAALLIGTDSGFSLYLIAILPLGYYAVYNFNASEKAINPMYYVISSVFAFCFVRVASSYIKPCYSYGDSRVDKAIYIMNFFVAVVAIVVFFSTLLNQIKFLENLRLHQNKQLEALSKTDSLTGLANRRTIEERYAQAEALKEGYALILGDIDDFKKVNDTYGHNIGDNVLKAVAEVFKNAVRGGDTVCRWGGEEILIFLPRCSIENATERAQDIVQNIRNMEMETMDGKTFHVTMTLGVAVSTEAEEFTEAVRIADERLYTGKQNGKNQVVAL